MPNKSKIKKHKRKNHCDDKNNDSSGNLADLSSNEDDVNVINGSFEKLQVDKPYEVKHSDVYGRYLVTSRDIKKGEVLIEVDALVIGPCAESLPICLGCYVDLFQLPRKYFCPDCGWILCSNTCTGYHTDNGHSTWECKSFKEHKLATFLTDCDEKDIRLLFESILSLRCLLLKDNDPERYRQIIEMESHNKIRRNIPSLWNRNQEFVVERIRNQWGYTEFSEEEIHTICGILEVNSFEVGTSGCRGRALYPEAYLICHDCQPVTTHNDDLLTHKLHLRSTVPMKKGDTITLSYSYTLQGTLKRREHLHETKFFWCSCKRCKDPTELGTHASTLLCPKCTNGFILSTDSLNQDADWKCRSCNYTVGGKSILILLERLFDELEVLDPNSIKDYEDYLKRYANVLHPNHYLILSAKHSLCQLVGRSDGFIINELDLSQLQKKEQYCRDLLNVVNVLEPGASRIRGIISYELHAPMMVKITREFENRTINSKQLRCRLKEIIRLLQESYDILKIEPIGSSEHSISLAAHDALKKMGNI